MPFNGDRTTDEKEVEHWVKQFRKVDEARKHFNSPFSALKNLPDLKLFHQTTKTESFFKAIQDASDSEWRRLDPTGAKRKAWRLVHGEVPASPLAMGLSPFAGIYINAAAAPGDKPAHIFPRGPSSDATKVNRNGKGVLDPEIEQLFGQVLSNGWTFRQITDRFCAKTKLRAAVKTFRRYAKKGRVTAESYVPLRTVLLDLSRTKP